ncbi:UDP-N-acetylmuramate:L-alanyl-gamma-D-glutamyl-meso-diaminopimelate ligase [Leucothrix arctica]|uniref:UDP-N-acetylmuramate--L-alanyl-gamma-D-glutamyl-meso-2,6-diaminoheptandioate ligase n=1 Tax=Leucothrix arctica TaxID=1481894 RepID=A0A317CA37_9GAMM|nr:UDP-N-acetylmuramate:L-alanyl-gamma-D-glutamyl-meso-diaminopimelate ligase [Leucothrix arctica]PWQ94193.1 UDP-N-acetylmuramate:L-alanyl-gamma-D-glutamyl-meso-diaminopimelate ligase [Leucothrix arctica]
MKVHILGICGTFMGGVATLARAEGHEVSGADENVYPPMSTLLESQGIDIQQGFHSSDIPKDVDQVVVGNVMTRGKAVVEDMLDQRLRYTSGPQWLYENVLQDRWVLAVAGTHGKTTTASMLAWILEYAKMSPGFLIGGVPENFGVSARLGDTPFFVVEADEYDTAFFDKRSKFVHYHPRTLVLNNLEYDHADIFPDLDAIKTQFHHLMRTVPSNGLVVSNSEESNLQDVLDKGCWTPVETFASSSPDATWTVELKDEFGGEFEVYLKGELQGTVSWSLMGQHNISNALASIAAARHVGVPAEHAIDALSEFKGVKRRMQLRGEVGGVRVYDDFAHHPTAIETTLSGLRKNVGDKRIVAILEPRSNTMRMGVHEGRLAESLALADEVILFQPEGLDWDLHHVTDAMSDKAKILESTDAIVDYLVSIATTGDQFLIMSNGGFGGIHDKLLTGLEAKL